MLQAATRLDNRIGESGTQQTDAEQPIASVELDRFCVGCGYNLRTLAVFADPRTEIPIVRCTECG